MAAIEPPDDIGTNLAGTAALPNSDGGIQFVTSSGRIGGATAAERNIISGNGGAGLLLLAGASGNQVLGNLIGTDESGTKALGNAGHGILMNDALTKNNFIGGTGPGEGNVISGNGNDGIFMLSTSGNTVRGNRIGTNVNGSLAIPNADHGITMFSSARNVIGGAAAGSGNVISGNKGSGIRITDSLATGNQVQGNLIGPAADGTRGIGNSGFGVLIADTGPAGNIIGGTNPGEGNVISWNGVGTAGGGISLHDAPGNLV